MTRVYRTSWNINGVCFTVFGVFKYNLWCIRETNISHLADRVANKVTSYSLKLLRLEEENARLRVAALETADVHEPLVVFSRVYR